MALNTYRRHASNCVAGRESDHRTYEADELRGAAQKCFCPIYASGTLQGKFKRANTERTSWAEAKVVIAGWETAGCWDGPIVATVAAVIASASEPVAETRITIDDAIGAFLAVREGSGISASTLRKHRTFAKQIRGLAIRAGT